MPIPESAPKVARTLAREEAYAQLRGWIIDGTLRPAEPLHDQAIGARLGVSRTPVREALRRLQDEGLVETALNRWTRVAPLDLGKALEIYAVIVPLELAALEAAFPRIAGPALAALRKANRAMREAGRRRDPAAALAADESFHEVWVARANNGELLGLVRQLKAKLRRVELAYFDEAARVEPSYREHLAVTKAIRRGSLPQARAAVRRNWAASVDRIRALADREQLRAQPEAL